MCVTTSLAIAISDFPACFEDLERAKSVESMNRVVRNSILVLSLVTVIAGLAWIVVFANSDFTIQETLGSLDYGQELAYHELQLPSRTRLTVKYDCVQSEGQLEAMVLDRDSFARIRSGGNASITPMARSVGKKETLDVYSSEDKELYVIFKPVYMTQIRKYSDSILKEQRFGYYTTRLENNTHFRAELSINRSTDVIRLMIINQTLLDKMLVGWTPLANSGYSEESGTGNLTVNWRTKSDDNFYVMVLPTSQDWPVSYLLRLSAVKTEGDFPISFKYSIYGKSDGPWILGIIPIVGGTAALILISAEASENSPKGRVSEASRSAARA